MPAPNTPAMTLAQVRDHLSTLKDLKGPERTAMVSAINRFADIASLSPSQILADPGVIRDLKETANWQLASRAQAADAVQVRSRLHCLDQSPVPGGSPAAQE